MNSILLKSNINKFAGAKYAPKTLIYQAKTLARPANENIVSHELSHKMPPIGKATLLKILERPKFITKGIKDFYKNFGIKK